MVAVRIGVFADLICTVVVAVTWETFKRTSDERHYPHRQKQQCGHSHKDFRASSVHQLPASASLKPMAALSFELMFF